MNSNNFFTEEPSDIEKIKLEIMEELKKAQDEKRAKEEEEKKRQEERQQLETANNNRKKGAEYFKNLDENTRKKVDDIASNLIVASGFNDRNMTLHAIQEEFVNKIKENNKNNGNPDLEKDIYDYLQNELSNNRHKYIFTDGKEASNSINSIINNFENFQKTKTTQKSNNNSEASEIMNNANNSQNYAPSNHRVDDYSINQNNNFNENATQRFVFQSDEDLQNTIQEMLDLDQIAMTIPDYIPPTKFEQHILRGQDGKIIEVLEQTDEEFARSKIARLNMKHELKKRKQTLTKAIKQDLDVKSSYEALENQQKEINKKLANYNLTNTNPFNNKNLKRFEKFSK